MIYIDNAVDIEAMTGYAENHPLIGYHNVVLSGSLSGLSAVTGFPMANLADPATYSRWKQPNNNNATLAIAAAGNYNYIGIARHNLGSISATLSVIGNDGVGDTTLIDNIDPTNDEPIILVFNGDPDYVSYSLHLTGMTDAPEIAVVYLGQIMALPNKIYVGHTPIIYGRAQKSSAPNSETGEFLGRVVLSEMQSSAIVMQNIPADVYRNSLDAWLSSDDPFFFAWRPSQYPSEVGYVWRTGDVRPTNQRANGMMNFSMNIAGIK